MNRKSIRIGVCAKWILGALALAIASMSYASSNTLVGGGSILPAIGYVGDSTSNPVYPAGSGSLFGVFSAQTGNPSVSYCRTTDGVALAVFFGETISGTGTTINVEGTCPSEGFGAKTVGRTDLTQPNYISLDTSLSATDYSSYQTNHGSSDYPTQFPALAAAIAIAFNLTDSEGNKVTSSEVNFTDAQLCSIFDGTVTNWDATSLASAFTLPAGDSIPSEPINVQYRSDGNGTTFSLSNHLAYVCGEINSTYFETSQVFTTVVGNFESTIPSNWTGSNGAAAVANAVANTTNSVGYVETANALATNPALQFADVNGKSPVSNFGGALTITGSALVYNEVISSTNNANGTAAIAALSNPPTTSCIALVKPANYAIPGSTGGIMPTGTYPIVAIAYLLANAEGNGSDLTDTQALLESPYNSTIKSSVTTVGPETGLAFLTLGTNAFTAADVGGCIAE